MRRRDRRDGGRRRDLTDPELPERIRGSSARRGWEYVLGLGLEREAPRVGEQAAALLSAPACPAGATTVVLDAEQVALQVHESVGPPDRARPRLRHRGRVRGHELPPRRTTSARLRYGSEHMNITADPTTPERPGHVRLRRRGRVRRSASRSCASRRARRVPELARDRGEARRRRRRLDARRRLEPDAARPDDEPPSRAGRRDARGAARRRRRRPLPRDEQELVDRRQAPQLPVRHAGRVGDQATASSAGCCATRRTRA